MEKIIRKAIIETMVFFDLFDFPLTKEELWRYLYSFSGIKIEQEDFFKVLKAVVEEKLVATQGEYYFLFGREAIVMAREEKIIYSLSKRQRAEKLVRRWLRFLPNIAGVFLIGPIVYGNAKKESDIDFLIVAKPGRIWTVRFLAAWPLKLLNLRPTERVKKDRFCLSYFITADNLNLESTKIDDHDILLVYWLAFFLEPLLNRDEIWQKFLSANQWLENQAPNWPGIGVIREETTKQEPQPGWPGNFLERLLKKIQCWYLPDKLRRVMNKDKSVIINDQMLKFHSLDRRAEVLIKWREKINQYEL
ncbi:MAG TPA: nucleotidyltransferase domain-containing protein [bacterium]|nr:nucleotidyltransferase domain-containing protein [bacterium]HPL95800.1 nucleotidyltransferase domain-containing protein [bacterium]